MKDENEIKSVIGWSKKNLLPTQEELDKRIEEVAEMYKEPHYEPYVFMNAELTK